MSIHDEHSPTHDERPGGRPDLTKGARRITIGVLAWPLTVIVVALLAYLAYLKSCETVSQTGQIARETVKGVEDAAAGIAESMLTGSITTTFIQTLPKLVAEGGLKLELAAYESEEIFERSNDKRLLWDLIPLGTTVTEIRVPVTYRYHLRLDDPWLLQVQGHTCVVQAPIVRPTLPPALHLDRMERRSEQGWLRFNAEQQMRELETSIIPSLNARASNQDHLNLVREQCRVKVAEFVRTWLLHEDHWREDRFSAVIVIFADELLAAATARGPTIELSTSEVPGSSGASGSEG